MSDNLRQYRAIRKALTQGDPGKPTGHVARRLTTLAALISGIVAVLWYFPERKIAVISTSYADLSVSQHVEKSVTQCARPLRFPWTSPM
jgi:hypothetical protein